MKKKLIIAILLCIVGLSMLGCGSSKNSNTSDNQNKQVSDNEDKNSKNDSDKSNDEDNDSEEVSTEDNENMEKMTSKELAKYYEEIRPKVTAFLKEKLEKPNEGKGDQYKVYENKDEGGYKGVSSLEYKDDEETDMHFTCAVFGYDIESGSINAYLMQNLTSEDIEKNGIKIKGTLFQDLIDLVSPDKDKINYDDLEKKISDGAKSLEAGKINDLELSYSKHTYITLQRVGRCMSITVNIE